jgi:ABC-type multidrug transport system fused ATPase/permease subunit
MLLPKMLISFDISHRYGKKIFAPYRIVILKNGIIEEQGSPSELLEKDNFYLRIIR